MSELLLMAIIPPIVGLATYAAVRLLRRKDEPAAVQRTSGAEPRMKS
jgi:hypothetical protein